jgi:hypothetical protein
VFKKIPALDGMDGWTSTFPTRPRAAVRWAAGEASETYGPEYRPDLLNKGGGRTLGVLAVVAGLWWLFGR